MGFGEVGIEFECLSEMSLGVVLVADSAVSRCCPRAFGRHGAWIGGVGEYREAVVSFGPLPGCAGSCLQHLEQ